MEMSLNENSFLMNWVLLPKKKIRLAFYRRIKEMEDFHPQIKDSIILRLLLIG
jgi:hypothetical protein